MIDNRQLTRLRLATAIGFAIALLIGCSACTVPNPNYRPKGGDAGVDSSSDAGPGVDAAIDAMPSPSPSPSPTKICTANEILRCDGNNLVRCNAAGTSEVSEACSISCNSASHRCADLAPSNGLSTFLDQSTVQPDLNLGTLARINTDTGVVTVDDSVVAVESATVVQSGAPTIRVFIVRSLTTKKVLVTGKNALAIVSNGDITVNDLFDVSGHSDRGPGAFNDGVCSGKRPPFVGSVRGGAGGPGFGSPGAKGGSARNANGFQEGGAGGATTGNASLVPLRGGCDEDTVLAAGGKGGGAIQLVSRTKILIAGTVAANGSSDGSAGSGGGILLEAPIVDVPGKVFANGASAGLPSGTQSPYGCGNGEDGKLDTKPAVGGRGCQQVGGGILDFIAGGNGWGAALSVEATDGESVDTRTTTPSRGGNGGAGVGRIRINAVPDGVRGGIFSPSPSKGTLGTR